MPPIYAPIYTLYARCPLSMSYTPIYALCPYGLYPSMPYTPIYVLCPYLCPIPLSMSYAPIYVLCPYLYPLFMPLFMPSIPLYALSTITIHLKIIYSNDNMSNRTDIYIIDECIKRV